MSKEKLFSQPTKIGTKIYAYDRYKGTEFDKIDRKVYDIIHLNLEGEEEFLRHLTLRDRSEEEMKDILDKEVNKITDIFDIGAEAGQQRLLN